MPKITEGRFALGALVALAFWLFVGLPIYYGPPTDKTPEQCSSEKYKNYGFWEKTRCDPVAYFTVWLVGFTGVLSFSTIALWWATLKGSERQSSDMKESVAVATRSAEIAEKTLRNLEIPHVYPVEMTYSASPTGQIPNTVTISAKFKNYGRSPAILRGAWFKSTVTRPENPSKRVCDTERVVFMVDGMIGETETSDDFSFSPEQLLPFSNQIASGKLQLNILVHVAWFDVLGDSFESNGWYVWNFRRRKFVAGTQIWAE